ncbi:orotidine-5'-phosphate decarboxylase [Novipirellula artificiosorum]|uniref:Orotidine 5'-phosphate decarboxylase n=1 Tax=Novipirellula artificiosorum TaxID=2528016 RepID=A0A5C6DVQ1_9BACT|nr:orotidine-5'-phosphate decarboxylase [Novipirellula artificiosorum]TWU40425.1 Orotidine 5'-phosphate decarboxylase [Novipirellula artificiosorum]
MNATDSTSFADRLADAVGRTRSVTCVGLDPRLDQLPRAIAQLADGGSPDAKAAAYTQFCREIIDVVKDRVPIVKPQAAFFEQLGPAGMIALGDVIRYASESGLLVITDAKRNDIGSTATAYAQAYLGTGDASPWGSDSLTISPYLGRDSLEPFVEVCDRRASGVFVLVKTSNPGGGLLQDRVTDGQTVYGRVAELVSELNQGRIGASGYGPVGAVVGATYPEQLAEMRAAMPNSWILIPGFGAQGGSAADVLAGFDSEGSGAIVNNSRNLIFAYRREPFVQKYGDARWQDAVSEATDEMNQLLLQRFSR